MADQCRQAYTNIGRALSGRITTWRNVLFARRTGAQYWLFALVSGFACFALSAALFTVIGAQAQPIVTRIGQTPTQSVYLFDGIPPYTEECTLEGISTVQTLPPGLVVEYAKPDAFCTSDGAGNGRLTLLVTGKCRLVRWQGTVIESPCTRLPLIID